MNWQLVTVSVGVEGQFPVWAREVDDHLEIRGLSATPFERLDTRVPRTADALDAQVADTCRRWFREQTEEQEGCA
jgi:hypothetical protein